MKSPTSPRRVAISLAMQWGYKRHLEVYAGCQRYAEEAGWECSINPAVDAELRISAAKKPPFDGVIARVTQSLATAAQKARVPVVNTWLNTPVKGLPSIFPDYEAVGIMAAEHLLGRGFRQFGYLGYKHDIDSRLELRGFKKVIEAAGFKCSPHHFSRTALIKKDGWPEFYAGLEKWGASWKPPIGVFVTRDLYGRYLHDVCRKAGLHVSQDVAIVGRENEPTICGAPTPTLTSIDLGYEQIGYRAAEMLDRLMNGEAPPASPELVAPLELIPRQSTDSFAATDRLVARALLFIAENCHHRIEVKHVAEAVATTRRTLERRFRLSVERSIAEEITRFRLERAKRRMVETDEPLKTVAHDSGFLDSNHFYKTFVRVEGTTPTQYRVERQR
ncbi:MAG: substrate-binding domain-containing protein [Verrucomicrobiales bacterium]